VKFEMDNIILSLFSVHVDFEALEFWDPKPHFGQFHRDAVRILYQFDIGNLQEGEVNNLSNWKL